jgi:hypothetical protein
MGGITLESAIAFIVGISGFITAIVALRKTKVDYSTTIVDGFNKLLKSYTDEITRLTQAAVITNDEHKKELEDREGRHAVKLEELQRHYINQLGDLQQQVKLLQEKVGEQEKTILQQARKISKLENGGH